MLLVTLWIYFKNFFNNCIYSSLGHFKELKNKTHLAKKHNISAPPNCSFRLMTKYW